LLKWKYSKNEETFLKYKRAAIRVKNRLREIKQENWKTFLEGINKFTNPSYTRFRGNGWACRNQRVATELTQVSAATDKHGIVEEPLGGSDLYSVRLEVIKGGHVID
jgi:hypothetical protein